ncbi:ATP-binding protein [Paucibacter sp. O1-1]|nr:ATP-binding protein [Paucibacter sp. O1-1]MDA3826883.1 ATP-binding protein [Paucibacter sp. O1-1]
MRRLGRWLARRAWPASLVGRVAAILFLALLLAHSLTLVWLLGGRAELGRRLMLDYLGPDVAAAVATLERLPAAERPAWLARIARPNYRFHLAAPPAGAEPDRSALGPRIAATLQAALGPARPLALLTQGDAGQRRFIALRLADGAPLTLELWALPVGLSTTVWAVVAAQLALFALAAWWGVRLATRPLTRLARAADGLDPEQAALASPLDENGPTEVAGAARAFNAMQRRIAAHLAERAQILAAVSHDLQTPITRMRLRAELLDEGPLRERLQADLGQMQALVEEGIAYARSAHAALEPPCRTDLRALLDALVCDYQDLGAPLSLRAEAVAPLLTRPLTLRRLVGNLLDNALKFAGSAELSLVPTGTGIEITVADRGPGIPEDQLAAVLQPFHRLEGSRNRGSGGTGLGLAIAEQLALSLGGRLSLANRDGGGLCATLSLPAARLSA